MPDSHRVYSYSAVLMGSPILLKLFSHDEALASRVFRLIKQYEDLLTVNRAHSQVMDINHAAGQHPVTVSRPVFELIRCAKAASLFRDSAFNLAIGPLVKRWKIGFQGDSVPPDDEIASLLAITRPEDVLLDEASSSVFLTRAGMEIDLGAIAKGISPTGCVITCIKRALSWADQPRRKHSDVRLAGRGLGRRAEKTVRR